MLSNPISWLFCRWVSPGRTSMLVFRHNREVAKLSKYQMFTASVHDLLSARLSVVVSRRITRLPLLFGDLGGGWIGRRSLAETQKSSGRVSAAPKSILPFLHDASGALSSEQESLMRGTSEPFDCRLPPVGLHQRKMFRWRRFEMVATPSTDTCAPRKGERGRWPSRRRLRGGARNLQLETAMKQTLPIFIAALLLSVSGAEAFGPSGTSVAINITTTPTQLVSPSGSTQIYVTAWDVLANTGGNFSLVYGTTVRTPCDTGTVALTGTYNLMAQGGLSRDGGIQPLYVIPAGNTLCAVTSGGSVSFAGSLSYTQY
jgi:hypothetical protein